MKTSIPTPRLRYLVDRRLDRTTTRQELAELEQMLRYPQAMNYYLESAEQVACLELLAAEEGFTKGESSLRATEARPQWRRLLPLSAAAVALLSVGAVLMTNLRDPKRPVNATATGPQEAVATVLRVIGPLELSPSDLHPGERISFQSGLAEIEFADGIHLYLEGPASLKITGESQATLESGRCVVNIPYSAPPFELTSRAGSFKATNAEFAAEVKEDHLDLGLLEGWGHFTRAGTPERPWRVNRRHAISCSKTEKIRSIAFQFRSFHRSIPSRELAWEAPADSYTPTTIEHDLTGLIWGASAYRVYFKWMHGADALHIHGSEILLDGKVVTTDIHQGITGDRRHTKNNSYRFSIPEGDYSGSQWTLRTKIQTNARRLGHIQISENQLHDEGYILQAGDPRLRDAQEKVFLTITPKPDSQGVLLLEDNFEPTAEDYCHTWEYTFNGSVYRRTFYPDGTAGFIQDGEIRDNFDRSTWEVEEGILVLTIRYPSNGQVQAIERHLIDSEKKLIFLDCPYSAARRVTPQISP